MTESVTFLPVLLGGGVVRTLNTGHVVGMESAREGGSRVSAWRNRALLLKLSKDLCLGVNAMAPGNIMKLSTIDNQTVGHNEQIKEMVVRFDNSEKFNYDSRGKRDYMLVDVPGGE